MVTTTRKQREALKRYYDRVEDSAQCFMEEGMSEEDAYETARSIEPARMDQ